MRGFSVPRSSLLFLAVSVCLVADSLSLDSYSYWKNFENDGDDDVLVEDENDEERRYEEEQHFGVTEMISERERKLDEIDRSHKLTQEYAHKAGQYEEEHHVVVTEMISDRIRMIKEIGLTQPPTLENAEKARQELRMFTETMHDLVNTAHLKGLEEISQKLQMNSGRAHVAILRMLKEIGGLRMLNMTLSLSPHHRKFVPLFCEAQAFTDWSKFSTHPDPMRGATVKAYWKLADRLGILLENSIATDLERNQRCAVDVTLDIRTAESHLVISHDGKQVSHGRKPQPQRSPDDLERFHPSACVLGNEGFRSGTFYYEVLVGDSAEWVLGVARKSVDRKRDVELTPQNGYWTVSFIEGEGYQPQMDAAVRFSLHSPAQNVGVFVDYGGGQVSFYDVDNKSLIYAYDAQVFNETLYPLFCPGLYDDGENATPLVITPVSQINRATQRARD